MKSPAHITRLATYAAILIAGLFWIWFSKAPPGSTTSGEIPAPRAGFLAPDFSLPNEDGEFIQLSDLKGQPVLLNIWATWCPPCRAEMPAMESVYQDYRAEGFTIVAVNAADQDNFESAKEFVRANGLTFPVVFDESGQVSRQYQVRALPTSFFIDAQGIIQEVVVGGPMSEALLRIRVEQLMESMEGSG